MPFLKIIPFLLLTLAMFCYPQEVLISAKTGLLLWAEYIVPALFPFFIISDLLMKQGFVHFLGSLLEPLMRPLFRLPGKASFIIAMTHTSGIPIGAILTCKMRKEKEITRLEGERLLAFTSNPSPGFMFGAIASGMLGRPALGIIIAGSVYLANLLVGLIFRFYGSSAAATVKYRFSLRQAWEEMKIAQEKNRRPLGQLMADSVRESISTILLVGGFIVFFSVITQMLILWKVTIILEKVINPFFTGILTPAGSSALIQGLLETTLGCKAAVSAFSALNVQIGMLTFLMGWGGLSVFAQVASFTASTDLRFLPFFLGRILHAFLALIISQIMLSISKIQVTAIALPAILTESNTVWLMSLRWSFLYFINAIIILGLLAFAIRIWQKII